MRQISLSRCVWIGMKPLSGFEFGYLFLVNIKPPGTSWMVEIFILRVWLQFFFLRCHRELVTDGHELHESGERTILVINLMELRMWLFREIPCHWLLLVSHLCLMTRELVVYSIVDCLQSSQQNTLCALKKRERIAPAIEACKLHDSNR
jgi:hypothetical protein